MNKYIYIYIYKINGFFYHYYSYEQQDDRCILDVLEYYSNANQQLTADLGRVSQRLRDLESHQPLQL